MSSFPRRSARLSPNFQQDSSQTQPLTSNSVPSFTQYSHPSSTSTTSHPSPTNNSINPPPPPPTPHSTQPRLQVQSPFTAQQSHLNVPLPSPSAGDLEPFFDRPHSQPNPYSTHPSEYMPQQQQQTQGFGQQNQQQPQQQHHPHTNSVSQQQQHPQNIHMNPGQLPPDFLAEAAKRAQMACLMRDLGDVSL